MSANFNRRRTAASGGAVAVAVAAAGLTGAAAWAESPPPAVDVQAAACEVEELPTPDDGVYSIARATSPGGEYIVGSYTPENEDHTQALLWSQGDFEVVDIPDTASAADVNSHADVVGTQIDPEAPETTAIAYVDGELHEIPVESGGANAINDDRQVVGSADGASGSQPYVWSPGDAAVEDLPLPEAAVSGEASGITEDGTVVGWYTDDDGVHHAYMWNSEHGDVALPSPDDVDPVETSTQAHGADGQWAYGIVDGAANSVRWDLSGDPAAERIDMERSRDVDAGGAVVGQGEDRDAVVVGHDGTVTLPDFGGAAEARGVSADGSVVAGSAIRDGASRAVEWTCG